MRFILTLMLSTVLVSYGEAHAQNINTLGTQVNAQSSNANNIDATSGSLSGAVNEGVRLGITSYGSDLGDAVPDLGVASIVAGGPCNGAAGSVSLVASGFGIGGGYADVDDACTVRQNAALMMNMCVSTGNNIHCAAAESYFRGSDDRINAAYEAVANTAQQPVAVRPAVAPDAVRTVAPTAAVDLCPDNLGEPGAVTDPASVPSRCWLALR